MDPQGTFVERYRLRGSKKGHLLPHLHSTLALCCPSLHLAAALPLGWVLLCPFSSPPAYALLCAFCPCLSKAVLCALCCLWPHVWTWQAYKYLMRFPSRRLCMLLNRARHEAFGRQMAEQVAASLPPGWPATKVSTLHSRYQSLKAAAGTAYSTRYSTQTVHYSTVRYSTVKCPQLPLSIILWLSPRHTGLWLYLRFLVLYLHTRLRLCYAFSLSPECRLRATWRAWGPSRPYGGRGRGHARGWCASTCGREIRTR